MRSLDSHWPRKPHPPLRAFAYPKHRHHSPNSETLTARRKGGAWIVERAEGNKIGYYYVVVFGRSVPHPYIRRFSERFLTSAQVKCLIEANMYSLVVVTNRCEQILIATPAESRHLSNQQQPARLDSAGPNIRESTAQMQWRAVTSKLAHHCGQEYQWQSLTARAIWILVVKNIAGLDSIMTASESAPNTCSILQPVCSLSS